MRKWGAFTELLHTESMLVCSVQPAAEPRHKRSKGIATPIGVANDAIAGPSVPAAPQPTPCEQGDRASPPSPLVPQISGHDSDDAVSAGMEGLELLSFRCNRRLIHLDPECTSRHSTRTRSGRLAGCITQHDPSTTPPGSPVKFHTRSSCLHPLPATAGPRSRARSAEGEGNQSGFPTLPQLVLPLPGGGVGRGCRVRLRVKQEAALHLGPASDEEMASAVEWLHSSKSEVWHRHPGTPLLLLHLCSRHWFVPACAQHCKPACNGTCGLLVNCSKNKIKQRLAKWAAWAADIQKPSSLCRMTWAWQCPPRCLWRIRCQMCRA